MVEIHVKVPDGSSPVNLLSAIDKAISNLDLIVSLDSRLAKIPDSRHWHIKKPGRSGTLEITMSPLEPRVWVSYHDNRIGDGWVVDAALRLAESIAQNIEG